jgi:VanZ family protein
MQADERRAKEAVFSPGFRRGGLAFLSVAYAIMLVLATPYPRPEQLLGRYGHADKLLHFVAYFLLAVIVAAAVWAAGRWSWRAAVAVAIALAVFGVGDEITQPVFGRTADALDWAADCAGIAVGILLVATASWAWGRGSRRG